MAYTPKVGDKVRAINAVDGRTPPGVGTVVHASTNMVEVDFPEMQDGHSGLAGDVGCLSRWNYLPRDWDALAPAPESLVVPPGHKYKFKVGDKVRAISIHAGHTPPGIGTIVKVPPDHPYYLVDFPEFKYGHSGGGSAEKQAIHTRWNYAEESLGKLALVESIVEAVASAAYPQLNLKETTTMALKIEDRTYINGGNAADQSDDGLISLIAQAEKEIEGLEKIATKSTKIAAKIAELQAGATRLAGILDARTK